jgi:hypothetical protein
MCDEFLEYRVIKSKRKAKCQLVSDDDDDIVSLDQIISADCDDDNVMRSLFPNDTSGSLKVCEKHGSQIKCFCSIERKSEIAKKHVNTVYNILVNTSIDLVHILRTMMIA